MRTVASFRLLAFARELQRATTFSELLEVTQTEIASAIGYRHAWLFVAETEGADEVRMIDIAGSKRDAAWEVAPVLKIRGDAMLEEIMRGEEPIVVEDARTDPRTNKAIVEQLQNRTIVNVPLRLLDRPFGCLGTGTFGDEGVRAPTAAQIDHLVGMAAQVAVAAGRIRFLDERRRSDAALLERERTITRQAQAIRELSIPVLEVRAGLILIPLIGTLDPERAQQLTTKVLARVRAARVVRVVIDVTGVPELDAVTAERLGQTAAACKLMGASVVISGISATVAKAMSGLPDPFAEVEVVSDLATALA
jgi:anti-anti-sigma regulatory factor